MYFSYLKTVRYIINDPVVVSTDDQNTACVKFVNCGKTKMFYKCNVCNVCHIVQEIVSIIMLTMLSNSGLHNNV